MTRVSWSPEVSTQPKAASTARTIAFVPQAQALRFGASVALPVSQSQGNIITRFFGAIVRAFRALMTVIANVFMRLAGRKTAGEMDADLEAKQNALTAEQRRNRELEVWRRVLSSIPPADLQRWDRERAERVKLIVQQANQPLPYNSLPVSTYVPNDPMAIKKQVVNLPRNMIGTNLRSTVPLLKVPDFNQLAHQPLDITLATYSPIKPVLKPDANIDRSDSDVRKFLAEHERSTNFLRRYGEGSINWTPEKVARDMMQNFYDGHNHTLEGVRLAVTYDRAKRSYKVNVMGQAQYNHREIEDLGAGDKSDNPKNAGGFGEGSKVFTIRLLAKHGVNKVTYASADWKLDFTMGNTLGQDINRVYKRLEAVPHQKGNSLEFETTDANLVKAILASTQYFYHPGNPDFKLPNFENDTWGYRVNGLGKPGNLYVVQRFEAPAEGKWENGLDGVTIYGFRKPPMTVFNAGRDRQNIDQSELGAILERDYVKTMKTEDLVQGVKNLQAVWNWPDTIRHMNGSSNVEKHPMVIMLSAFCSELQSRRVGVQFPKDRLWVAPDSTYVQSDTINYLQNKGYFICHPSMRKLGIPTVDDVMEGLRQHTPLAPTPKERQKIQLLKMAASALIGDLYLSKDKQKPLLRQKDVDRPLYLFDRQAVVDQSTTLARAVIDDVRDADDQQWHAPSIFKGSWFDRKYLNEAPFEELVSTYLHEMTHQYGGDGSHEFGYKLTDWIAESLASAIRNPVTNHRLSEIKTAWDDLHSRKLAAVA